MRMNWEKQKTEYFANILFVNKNEIKTIRYLEEKKKKPSQEKKNQNLCTNNVYLFMEPGTLTLFPLTGNQKRIVNVI